MPWTVARGYRAASAAERDGFGMLTSFAVTIGLPRDQPRARASPQRRLRSRARIAYHFPGQEKVRIHHFMPGIGLAFLTGAAAILKREDARELWLSLPFGTGVGLTFDEIAVLTKLDSPYWRART